MNIIIPFLTSAPCIIWPIPGKKKEIIKYLKLDVDSVYEDILVKYKGE